MIVEFQFREEGTGTERFTVDLEDQGEFLVTRITVGNSGADPRYVVRRIIDGHLFTEPDAAIRDRAETAVKDNRHAALTCVSGAFES